ncbi:MAG: hypothetical protein LAP86_04975 [Acidobacteriia bacterium]|nr:hypothetical protein [Terriglobia bacterium]
MNLNTITKRVAKVEEHLVPATPSLPSQSGRQADYDTAAQGQLQQLERDARRIMLKAECKGDYRTAVAAVHELGKILELQARLNGNLQEKEAIHFVNVQLHADTAARIASTYLARHRTLEAQ